MMFPYASSYMYLMDAYRPKRRSPWDDLSPADNPTDNYITRPWGSTASDRDAGFHGMGGTDTDPNMRRRALGAGLLSFGTSMLEAGSRGDWGGGLARGAQGFAEAFAGERDRARREQMEQREEQRRQAQEARAEEQERDRNRGADLEFERGTAELSAYKEQQDRGRQARAKTGKSADQMVSEIESLAASNPNDPKLQVMAKRAAGYALGEDSDLNKLADLHEQMTGQAFRAQDVAFETESKISAREQAIKRGVEADPRAAERRAEEELNISRGHLAVSRERAGREKEGLTDLQAYDRLERKVKEKMDARVEAYNSRTGRTPPPRMMAEWRKELLAEAMAEMGNQMNQVYDFTRDGRLLPGQ